MKVIDQGVGISDKDFSKLFQPYSKIEANAELNPNGTGMGLYNCKNLLEMLDSKIWIEPTKNPKAIFDKDVGTVIAFTIKMFPRCQPGDSS